MEFHRAYFFAEHCDENSDHLLTQIKLIRNVRHVEETKHMIPEVGPIIEGKTGIIKGDAILLDRNEVNELERDLASRGLTEITIPTIIATKSNWDKFGPIATLGLGIFSAIASIFAIYGFFLKSS